MTAQIEIPFYTNEDKTFTTVLNDVDEKPRVLTGFTITAGLRTLDSTPTQEGATITCSDSGGADFARGLVEIVVTDTVAATLTAGRYQWEIKVIDGSSLVSTYVLDPIIRVITAVNPS